MKTIKLKLNDGGSVDLGTIRIPGPGHSLEVRLPVGTQLHSSETVLKSWQSYDPEPEIIKPTRAYSIMEELIFTIPIKLPGAWHFRISSKDVEGKMVHYLVDPIIKINDKEVPIGSLVIQTNYGRCIGKVQDWLKNLKPISELGYNMIHLPPFQELGGSSHYSLKDQLQISRELFPPDFPEKERWPMFKTVLKKIEKELNIVFMADILLNHTNPTSEWLKEHPEAGYSIDNSPYLRPAYYVDKTLSDLSDKIARGEVPDIPSDIKVEHVEKLKEYLKKGLHDSDLRKFFTIDVDDAVKRLVESQEKLPKQFEMIRMRAVNYGAPQRQNILRTRGIVHDDSYQMGCVHVDNNYARALYAPPGSKEIRIDEFKMAIDNLNIPYYQHYESIVNEVVENVVNGFQYARFDPNGPKYGPITLEVPICWRYFSEIETKNGIVPLANNGWIFSSDPTDDFIAEGKECYLRRQIVIWGDNVKLRYGNKKEDNPWLWEHMTKYIQSVAEVVHALRLDNAHSTPLPVSEYFINEARKVNPNLYVMAELFTSSEELDIKYINHIGINSILREGGKRISPPGMTHLLWASGGLQVAAVDQIDSSSVVTPTKQIPGVIFDITHDNSTPYFDPLTVSSMISMSCSPIATNRGYDDVLPFVPSVVDEKRLYPLSENEPAFQPLRKLINHLHIDMALKQMNELLANYYGNLVSIFRCNSKTGEGIWMLIRVYDGETTTNKVAFPAPIDKLIFEGRINSIERFNDNGKDPIKPSHCNIFLNQDQNKLSTCKLLQNELQLDNFIPGSVIVFSTKLPKELSDFISKLEVSTLVEDFKSKVFSIGLTDLTVLLFRCSDEEKATLGQGSYDFPGFGPSFYAGTIGIETAMKFAAKSDAGMGSSVFVNIRDGNWLIDYMCNRLFQNPRLIQLEGYFRKQCQSLEKLPRFLIPKYLCRIVRALNNAARESIIAKSSKFIQDGDKFIHSLATTAISFYSPMKNAQLIHPHLTSIFRGYVSRIDSCTAAGFPHFSVGFMRSWGRDTFIALRGLFLVNGRFNEARDQLVAFGACLRHGLIPNLHDGGLNPRYNARDATWWFLQSLQDYAIMSGQGGDVFNLKVPRIFPCDDQTEYYRKWDKKNYRPIFTMGDIVQEIMTKHANGIHFREWNAGKEIDSVMVSEGFNIDIITDWTNGFILGGNQHNCGTWMDKMGSSVKAKNSGIPATPRDGAAIEIIGLLESTLRWLDQCYQEGTYKYNGVVVGNETITWSRWSSLLCSNFESWFYVPNKPEYDSKFFIEERHVGVRGIYKDSVGSSAEFSDYQFRPNVCIAMTVAPELFDPVHAVRCLNNVEERLMGKIGMKTLDPSDYRYRPYYHNDDDSEDFLTSRGFNYHNGPEWCWPVGYFFRASMRFRRGITEKMKKMLANIKKELLTSWANGLPELTQKDGEPCEGSCKNQAWSVAGILDILYDYSLYTENDVIDWDVDEEVDELIKQEE
ncbi:Glycogen debranching enzyme [Histomonas meleagridis]|uniref:Glycogen debranching enzyme n=1 Tax=Histomonas meleagridis TaxID=135588 RepID=UPI0035593AE5|nr:Glycogen debranching enzyme [Histomonas meleagridis]KAH0799821.1 Glycogen debranching enzyme [Histomonas meleagridis]